MANILSFLYITISEECFGDHRQSRGGVDIRLSEELATEEYRQVQEGKRVRAGPHESARIQTAQLKQL